MTPRRLTLKTMLAYGSGDFYGGGALYIVTTLYSVFLTTVVGLTPGQVGLILLGGKVWSAIANPLAGYLSDRTRSRWGRRRIYFLVGLVPVFAVLWLPVGPVFAWHFVAYMLFDTLFTLVKVPYYSILPEMTADFTERTRTTGVRMMFSQAASILGAFAPLSIVAWCGGGGRGYLAMGIIFGVIFTLPWLFNFLYLWEREAPPLPPGGDVLHHFGQLLRDYSSTLRNRTFVVHLGMYLLAFLNLDTFNGLVVFFVTCALGRDQSWARWLMTTVQGCQLLTLPLVTVLCYRIGNARTYRLSLALWGLGIVLLSLQPASAPDARILGCAVVVGLGLSGAVLTPWNMQTFIPDVDELMTGQRREGIYAGCMQFARQLTIGLALFMNNHVLAMAGFVTGALHQPSSVGDALHHYFLLAPLVFLGAGALLSTRFRLDPTAHRTLLDEIARLRDGGEKTDVDGNTRQVCETLTGQPYDTMWRPVHE